MSSFATSRAAAGAAVLAGITVAMLTSFGADVEPRVVAAASGLYLEDAAIPRPVATMAARVLRRGSEHVLQVDVGAIGAGVDPLPGVEGVPGSNLRTAEELERLLEEGGMRLVTRIGGVNHAGELLAVTRGRIPARRWREDGGLEPVPAARCRELPVLVRFCSVPLPPRGASRTFLEVGGVPRLLVEVSIGADRRSVRLESLAEPMIPAVPAAAGTVDQTEHAR